MTNPTAPARDLDTCGQAFSTGRGTHFCARRPEHHGWHFADGIASPTQQHVEAAMTEDSTLTEGCHCHLMVHNPPCSWCESNAV